jgi:KTSC domain
LKTRDILDPSSWQLGRLLSLLLIFSTKALSQEVDLKKAGIVSLQDFACHEVESSFINSVCYDETLEYLIVQIDEDYYDYCEISSETVERLLSSQSVGSFFNAQIKEFECSPETRPVR